MVITDTDAATSSPSVWHTPTTNTTATTAATAPAVTPSTSPFRPARQTQELEALRQRGLATLLNRHFTQAAQRIAREKAAAEAALRDLQQNQKRWAAATDAPAPGPTTEATTATSGIPEEDQPTTTLTASILDTSLLNTQETTGSAADSPTGVVSELYSKVQQWQHECLVQERETLALYQRYVDKFGATGLVATPIATDVQESMPIPEEVQEESTTTTPLPFNEGNMEASERTDPPGESFAMLNAKDEDDFREFYRNQLDPPSRNTFPSSHYGTSSAHTNTKGMDAPELSDQAESSASFHQQDEEEDMELSLASLVSGLTSVHSARTRQQILLDCEQTVQTFLQQEGKAVRQALQRGSVSGSLQEQHSDSAAAWLGSLQSHAADEAETMAQQMQGILHAYQNSHADTTSGTVEETSTTADGSASVNGQPFATSHPDQEWKVYFDETFQRHYYHEVKSNTTQWEPPADVTEATASLSASDHHQPTILEHVDVAPEVTVKQYRIAAYRRKARRRRRRLRWAAALVGAVIIMTMVGVYYWPHLSTMMQRRLHTGSSMAQPKVVTHRSQPRPPAIFHAPVSTPAVVSPPKKLMNPSAETVSQAQEAGTAVVVAPPRRPRACNVPLAYLASGYCRRLASENPPYDAWALVQSIMQ